MRALASSMLRRAAMALARSMKMKRPADIAQPNSGMRDSCFLAIMRMRNGQRHEQRPDVHRGQVVGHDDVGLIGFQPAARHSTFTSTPPTHSTARDHCRARNTTVLPLRSNSRDASASRLPMIEAPVMKARAENRADRRPDER